MTSQEKALIEALAVVRKYHKWLERVEQTRVYGGSYFGLDHSVGEGEDYCDGCAVLVARSQILQLELFPEPESDGA